MIKTNYHTHNELCDGSGNIEEYIASAIAKGFTALGFSSHAPLPIPNQWTLSDETLPIYLSELENEKMKWKNHLQIYSGLEIDYIPNNQTPKDARWNHLGLDFIIGSVHTTAGLDVNPEYKCVDGPLKDFLWLLERMHSGSIESLSEAYYTRICELLNIGGFSFLGHFDLMKKYNRNNDFYSESASWYRTHVLSALEVMANSGIILEVNTGAIARKTLDDVYPSPWILKEAHKREIAVMINSDAHKPEDVDCHFEESQYLLREIGFKDVWVLLDNQWTKIGLNRT